jgi:SAM-dependent methyltransferase
VTQRTYWEAVQPGNRRRDRLWRAHSDSVNLRLIQGWLPEQSPARLLKTDLFDEAAGEGLRGALQARGTKLLGLDISESILTAARRKHPDLIGVVADVRRLPFTGGAFDAVVSISTLDHFDSRDDITASLEEIYAILRPGGRLILTLDNLANPKILLRNALPWSLLKRTGLVPYYVGASLRPRQACRTLADIGFEIVEVQTIMHCPRVLAVLAAGLPVFASEVARRYYLKVLTSFEVLSRLPTRFLTGHFVAVLARRRVEPTDSRNPDGVTYRDPERPADPPPSAG